MYSSFQITDRTPVVMLTVGQLKELFMTWVKEVMKEASVESPRSESNVRYIYGIAGIAREFNVSYATAHKMKEGVLRPAVIQNGRKIMIDVEMAHDILRSQTGKTDKK